MKAMSCNTIFLLAVACCTLSVVMVAAGVDTRCSNYVCDLTNTDPSNYYDSSECDSVTCTSTCIKDDPAFEELLLELGAGTADRSTNSPVYLPITDWLSAQFPNQIFKILAMEVLGYQTRSAKMDDGWSILCCDKTVMWLETWPGDPFPVDPQGSLTRLPIGYTGFGGLYIPNYVMQAHPLASAYSAYKLLTEYQSLYPLTNTMPCNETLIDTSLGCVDDNRFCSMAASYWPNTSCVDGRYVPPQCVNNPDCQEIIYGAPIWDTGFFESVIKNLGLNFTFVYVGVDNLFRLVAQYALERRSFMFYMSGPDAILSKVPSTPLSLPPRTLWCEQTQNRDPTLSGANCSYDQPILYKTARDGDLAANPDLRRLFDSLQLSSVKLDALMAQHESGGGTLNVWDASCQWVRDNNATWKSWIVNTPPPSASSSSIIPVVAGVAGGVGAVIIIGVVLFFVYQRQMAMKSVENAPTTAPLALIFTDVESSTNLWEAFPEMAVAMEMHHALIRELIREYQCYEVKTIGDSFMIACNSLTEAVSLCVAIQRKLFNADWPQSLKYWKGDEENQPNMWHGLRVRAGVHWCKEVKPELDSVHGRYDYYGHDVNVSARVESLAAGGQTTMTEDTYRSMVEEPDYAMLAEDMICRPFCSGAELKGVQGTVTLYSLVPVELGGRVFKPLPNTTPCDDGAPLDGAEGDLLSSRESTVSHTQDNVTPVGVMLRKLVEDLLGYLGTPSDKDKALTELLIKNKLITDAAEVKRINFPRKVMMLTKHFTDIISRTTVQQIGAASMRRKPDSSGLYLHDMLGTSVMSSRNTVNLPALGVDTPTAHPNSVKN